MKLLDEKYRGKRKEMYVAFMHLEKAYGKVCREELWKVLHEYGVDDNLIWSIGSLYGWFKACMRFGSGVGVYFLL